MLREINSLRFSTSRLPGFALGLLALAGWLGAPGEAAASEPTKFRRVPTQYIAALGDPGASSGAGAQTWGLWPVDPGPRGVFLRHFDKLQADGGVAPARWSFDDKDWWLEENGVIMESPEFPLPPGQYVVTGNREVMSILTVHPDDENGDRRWELANDATLHDVTHLRCRSARYTPVAGGNGCSPQNADPSAFPVTPGGLMPAVAGCEKQDYTVLFVIGVAVES